MRTPLKLFVLSIALMLFACSKDKVAPRTYETENVIVIVMDGPRYSETWGDTSHQNIPRMANDLAQLGVINEQFYSYGQTFTIPGHTAIASGFYEDINNGGEEFPQNPSIFQLWREASNAPQNKSWVIASKGKVEVIGNCSNPNWLDQYLPSSDCGIDGGGPSSGYRVDSITFENTLNILATHHPNLTVINFREPDYSGHMCDWEAYSKGIQDIDNYIYEIINFVENDSIYKGKTTVFVTNDHGRHTDGVADGFCSHGDPCDGCQHINFYAFGPDFKENLIISEERELIDIPATIAELLNFRIPNSNGNIMNELFK